MPLNKSEFRPQKPVRACGPRDLHDITAHTMSLFGLAWLDERTDFSKKKKKLQSERWGGTNAISSDTILGHHENIPLGPPKSNIISEQPYYT